MLDHPLCVRGSSFRERGAGRIGEQLSECLVMEMSTALGPWKRPYETSMLGWSKLCSALRREQAQNIERRSHWIQPAQGPLFACTCVVVADAMLLRISLIRAMISGVPVSWTDWKNASDAATSCSGVYPTRDTQFEAR